MTGAGEYRGTHSPEIGRWVVGGQARIDGTELGVHPELTGDTEVYWTI